MVEEKVCYRDVGAHSQRQGIGRVQSGRDVWRVREGKRKGEWNRSQKAKVQKGRQLKCLDDIEKTLLGKDSPALELESSG